MESCYYCNKTFKSKDSIMSFTNEDSQAMAAIFCSNKCRVQYHLNELKDDEFKEVVLESIKLGIQSGYDEIGVNQINKIAEIFGKEIIW